MAYFTLESKAKFRFINDMWLINVYSLFFVSYALFVVAPCQIAVLSIVQLPYAQISIAIDLYTMSCYPLSNAQCLANHCAMTHAYVQLPHAPSPTTTLIEKFILFRYLRFVNVCFQMTNIVLVYSIACVPVALLIMVVCFCCKNAIKSRKDGSSSSSFWMSKSYSGSKCQTSLSIIIICFTSFVNVSVLTRCFVTFLS